MVFSFVGVPQNGLEMLIPLTSNFSSSVSRHELMNLFVQTCRRELGTSDLARV